MKRNILISFAVLFTLPAAGWCGEIWSYRKISDACTTYQIDAGVEIATIGGVTYLAVPDGTALTAGKAELQASLKKESVDEKLLGNLRAASVHYALLQQRISAYIKSLPKADARYFMLSFDESSIESELSKNGIVKSRNHRESLRPFLSADTDLTDEISAWSEKQKKVFGLDKPSITAIRVEVEK